MKAIFISFSLSFIAWRCVAAASPFIQKTDQFQPNQNQTVILQTPFGQPFFIGKADLSKLGGKQIHHIDLVYTSYKSSASFDQAKLNKQRMNELRKLLPDIDTDNPHWTWIEQTGAKDLATAATFFHGFVVHYTERESTLELRKFLEDLSVPLTTFVIDNGKGGTITYPSGTTITIPPNAVITADGKPVGGKYEFQYREFRDPAEIALSGLPMKFEEGNEYFNFSSVGMYELRGVQNGQSLQLSKSVSVDLNCTNAAKDVGLYQMDDQTGKWTKVGPVVFDPPVPKKAEVKTAVAAVPVANPNAVIGDAFLATGSLRKGENKSSTYDPKGLYIEWKTQDKNTRMAMNLPAWRIFMNKSKDSTEIIGAIKSFDQQERKITISSNYYRMVLTMVFDQVFNRNDTPNTGNTLLADGADANHTYPTVVRGLNSSQFGVYNADQIYKVQNQLAIRPKYVNQQTGKEITDLRVACLMDLNINGSFSFQPNNIICDANGRNALLLFTNDNRIYYMSEKDFAKTDKTKLEVSLVMKDVTKDLETPEDLKQMLALK